MPKKPKENRPKQLSPEEDAFKQGLSLQQTEMDRLSFILSAYDLNFFRFITSQRDLR